MDARRHKNPLYMIGYGMLLFVFWAVVFFATGLAFEFEITDEVGYRIMAAAAVFAVLHVIRLWHMHPRYFIDDE